MDKSGLNFLGFQVTKVIFDRPVTFTGGQFTVDIVLETRQHETETNRFLSVLVVTVSLNDQSIPFNLQIESYGAFEILGEVPDKVIEGYKSISAPAIVYPYVRAYVSNLTNQAGITAITLPAVNFAAEQSLSTKTDNK